MLAVLAVLARNALVKRDLGSQTSGRNSLFPETTTENQDPFHDLPRTLPVSRGGEDEA